MSVDTHSRELTAVAMSGGVDSSTVAAMLQKSGAPIVGLTMQLWDQRRLPQLARSESGGQRCCSVDDAYEIITKGLTANALAIPGPVL